MKVDKGQPNILIRVQCTTLEGTNPKSIVNKYIYIWIDRCIISLKASVQLPRAYCEESGYASISGERKFEMIFFLNVMFSS